MSSKPSGRVFRPLGKPESPSVLVSTDEQLHRLTCPYCVFGRGTIRVTRKDGETQVDTKQSTMCDSCGKPFGIRTRVLIVGVPLEDVLKTDRELDPDQTRPEPK